MCSRVHWLLLTVVFLWLGAAPLISFGQSAESASIVGKVTDDKGNAIPGVAIDVTSPALQVPRVSTISDQEGNYKVLDLPAPGIYRVAFSLTGFETFVRDGLNLPVDDWSGDTDGRSDRGQSRC